MIGLRMKLNFSEILEQFIIKHAYSTYFTKRKTLPLFELLNSLGFMGNDMGQREEIIKKCF